MNKKSIVINECNTECPFMYRNNQAANEWHTPRTYLCTQIGQIYFDDYHIDLSNEDVLDKLCKPLPDNCPLYNGDILISYERDEEIAERRKDAHVKSHNQLLENRKQREESRREDDKQEYNRLKNIFEDE